MTTLDLHHLAGAYALDAVDDTERAAFEAHLPACTACDDTVREFRVTAALLGTAHAREPGPTFRAHLLDRLARTPQLPAEDARRPVGRSGWAVTAATAGVVAALAVAIGLAWWSGGAGPAPVITSGDVLGAPDASTTQAETGAALATATTSRTLGAITITTRHFPDPGADRRYQVWLLGGREPRSAGLLRGGDAVLTASLPAGVSGVEVTTEPAAGSPRPSTPPVLILSLTS